MQEQQSTASLDIFQVRNRVFRRYRELRILTQREAMQPINFIRCAFPFNNSFTYYIGISASINTFFMEIILNKRKKRKLIILIYVKMRT